MAKMVRIQYVYHSIANNLMAGSGETVLSGLMPRSAAEKIVKSGRYEKAEIVEDSEGR